MKDAVSQPPKAKVSTDQKMMSWKCRLGINAWGANDVADPKRCHAINPMEMTMRTGIHMAKAPALCNHLPTSSPTMFMTVTAARAIKENAMKKAGVPDKWIHARWCMLRALLPAKYRTAGK